MALKHNVQQPSQNGAEQSRIAGASRTVSPAEKAGISYTAGRISNALAAFTRQRQLVRTEHRPLWEAAIMLITGTLGDRRTPGAPAIRLVEHALCRTPLLRAWVKEPRSGLLIPCA